MLLLLYYYISITIIFIIIYYYLLLLYNEINSGQNYEKNTIYIYILCFSHKFDHC